MSPVSRPSLVAVIVMAAVLTMALALPLQAALFQSPPAAERSKRPPAPPPKPGPAICSGWYYTIRSGDTLNRIAARYGVSVKDITRCNGLKSTTIYAGRSLLIPGSKPATSAPSPKPVTGACYHTAESGDTLNSIAASYGTTAWNLQSTNYIPNPNMVYAGQVLRVPCGVQPEPVPQADRGTEPGSSPGWYQVQAGDTVSKIAARFQVSNQDIISANELKAPYTIYTGQWLRIP